MRDYLGRRDGFWHYVRRVPTAFAALDRRVIVRQTTKVRIADDPRGIVARRAVAKIDAEHQAYWKALYLGQSDNARERYEAARDLARALGFDYVPARELLSRPTSQIVARVEAVTTRGLAPESKAADAVLGLVEKPAFRLKDLFTEYERIQRASLSGMSEEQKRRWRNAKRLAAESVFDVVGDKTLSELTRGDALDFQAWWQERVLDEGIEIGTANKSIGQVNKMYRTINTHHRLELPPLFSELRIEGETTASRSAFAAEFVQTRILEDGAFAELNEEARRVIYLMADTGLRISEAVNLTADTIVLDHQIPYVHIWPDGRKLKTAQSFRQIPLVGAALAAMKLQPNGFPRYRDKNAGLSALVNKFLTNAKLRPTPNHTLYSLRHTFEDRLTAVGAPEKVMAVLMGHKYQRPRYGDGPSLVQKRNWLQRIAFKPPASL
ncbi:tyrosine-type recombinase/integrase [Bosea sp. PAMC 26642]|uniref:tyrosine-type recombinase/integrase n=1 Tax=Bosea sp. (strain PAMC 26642) TaxID=1792307 RepID=UPI00076FE035|nr:tyrosine-type recombinase/integrase [Bosea sp. PAMC 26642]AMJ61619.1 integrase [Bosea sp. PAMC 26642]